MSSVKLEGFGSSSSAEDAMILTHMHLW